ncbi:MAG: DNA repair protein RecN [Clostridia bacterium]|nr:DNA repair protein RecN [Clostridia bacterium]
MIESLHIENIAVIKSLDVEFGKGLTVLSGETGAGKSIMIDSLNLLLGGRTDRELIRTGESRAEVSAVFSPLSPRSVELLSEMGFDPSEGRVMLCRTVSAGASSARINGRAVTLSMLREIGETLFNIHGQNDNQQLLDPRNHANILDSYADCAKDRQAYAAVYREMLHLRTQIDSLRRDAREQTRLGEMLRYQIADIDSGKLKAGEEEALCELAKRLQGAEQITKCCALVEKALRGGEKNKGAIYLVDRSASAMESIADSLTEADALVSRLNDIRYELEDIAETAAGLTDFGGEDVLAKLDRVEARLDIIAKLKRKYGSSVEEILDFRRNAAEQLERIEHADDRLIDLGEELKVLESKAKAIALSLRERRRQAAKSLTEQVADTLRFLDMPKVRFEVGMRQTSDFLPNGMDEIEFLIATNAGEPLMPMAKIASGGELARIMLSLKNVLNTCDGLNTVIFDEIDTGISGKTSRKVGIKLKEIGRSAQVLCVTHSAQIASLADHHLYISKQEIDGRTQTALRELDMAGRTEEVARILGGIEITEAQRRAAKEMIEEGEQYG